MGEQARGDRNGGLFLGSLLFVVGLALELAFVEVDVAAPDLGMTAAPQMSPLRLPVYSPTRM
jgi:hypothetical protein